MRYRLFMLVLFALMAGGLLTEASRAQVIQSRDGLVRDKETLVRYEEKYKRCLADPDCPNWERLKIMEMMSMQQRRIQHRIYKDCRHKNTGDKCLGIIEQHIGIN